MAEQKLESGSIFHTQLIGNIDDRNTENLVRELNRGLAHSGDNIRLLLVSEGGLLTNTIALYDYIFYIRRFKPVNIITDGKCASAAVLLLQAGTRRFSGPDTIFMVHPGRKVLSGDFRGDELEGLADRTKIEQSLYIRMICKRTKMDERTFREFSGTTTYLTAPEAKRENIIDEIENFEFTEV